MEYSPKKMQENIEKNNIKFKKQFGQNFICDENIINSIIDKSKIDKDTLVIEVGPGAGSLTNKLALKAKNVLCYEIDKDVKEILESNIADFNNVEIIYNDFLQCNVLSDIKKYSYKKLYLVANLPYYITTPIIMKLIDDHINIDKIVVMVQKEVGDRLSAKVGTKDYNSLTIFINYYYNVKKLFVVSKNVFIPKPNVDSIVIALEKKNNRLNVKDEKIFFKLIRDSFVQKRKTLRNNLKDYDFDKIREILIKNNYTEDVRAEKLPIEIFAEIANNI
jgi:16S rRNA (adenine1518-N6/adenine1519-N6)-dimethyltransferase